MISILKGRSKKNIYNSPISKNRYIELLEKHPKGFYINDGKNISHCDINTDYKKFDIKIDFINSMKIFGLILGVFYFFVFKSKVQRVVKVNSVDTEQYLKDLAKRVEVVMDKKPTPKKRGRPSKTVNA